MDFWFVWSFAAVVIFAAYFVRGIAGFGSGLIAVPLLALILPVPVVVPVVVLFDWLGSASQGLRNRHLIAWRDELPLIPFTLTGVALGLTLLDTLESDALKQALGGFVIVYAVYQVLPLPALRGSRLFAVPCGFVGGVIGTLFGTGGPLYVIYFGLRDLDKDAFRATFSANYLIDGAIRLIAFAAFGLYGADALPAILAGLPLLAAGLWLGGRVHSTLSVATFARLISLLLLGSGVALLVGN